MLDSSRAILWGSRRCRDVSIEKHLYDKQLEGGYWQRTLYSCLGYRCIFCGHTAVHYIVMVYHPAGLRGTTYCLRAIEARPDEL